MNPFLITAPALEPVTLAEVKAWLKQDSADDDAVITALIAAARATIERATRLQLIAQTWRLYASQWPFLDQSGLQGWQIELPPAPVSSIVAVTTYDQFDTPSVVPPVNYRLTHSQYGPRLVFPYLPAAPGRISEGIVIDVVAGFGTLPTDVPEPLRQAIRLLSAHLYANRGDDAAAAAGLPASIAALIAPYRRLTVRVCGGRS